MHRTGVVGLSWRHRRADALAAFTIPRDERVARLPLLAAAVGVRELVYVATCNRVEVVFAAEGAVPMRVYRRRVFAAILGREPRAGEAEQMLRVWQGEGAAEHLFLTAAGLESARIGESEVTGQIRESLGESQALGLLGPRLTLIFGEALKVAKRVRPVTEGKVGRVSLADIAVRHVAAHLERAPGGVVALVGVSPLIERCSRDLVSRGVPVVLVNRTLERATALAGVVGCAARSLDEFRRAPDRVEALVVATGAKEPVLDRADLERIAARTRSGESPLVVDLGVPPNVAPEDAAAADVRRIGMDEISLEAAEDREHMLMEFAEARQIVDGALAELRRSAAERLVVPMIQRLRLRYRHTALEGVERLFRRELSGLGEPERDAVRRWAETLAHRFAHLPSAGLRDLVFEAGPAAAAAFFGKVEPELAQALRETAEPAAPDGMEA